MHAKVPVNHLRLKCLLVASLIFPVAAPVMSASIADDLAIRKTLEQRIDEITRKPVLHKKILREGRDRTVLCFTCHGENGMAVQPLTPNLAGQNPVYLIDQFQRYGDDRRINYWMGSLAKTFTTEDKIKIALYFSQMEMLPSGGGNPALLGDGEKIFKTYCVKCHGADARGQEGYARLAGQRFDYVVKMLKEFRDRTGERTNIWMTGVAIRLNDRDIESVATYLANLK